MASPAHWGTAGIERIVVPAALFTKAETGKSYLNGNEVKTVARNPGSGLSFEDAWFCAEARTLVPALADALERATATKGQANVTTKKISQMLTEVSELIDRETSAAYSQGAEAVWSMLGCGAGPEFPNEAVAIEGAQYPNALYEIRPKAMAVWQRAKEAR